MKNNYLEVRGNRKDVKIVVRQSFEVALGAFYCCTKLYMVMRDERRKRDFSFLPFGLHVSVRNINELGKTTIIIIILCIDNVHDLLINSIR